jgi:outer membrane protein, heavy metal efflux system
MAIFPLILALAGRAVAQDPLDLRGRLDTSPGGTLLGNRPGMSIGRTPQAAYQRPDRLRTTRPDRLESPPILNDAPQRFEVPSDDGPQLVGDGLTLENAIARLIACNPDVVAARESIVQARTDVVTAGLRTNPQFFTDLQQVPYRVLAPNQVDVNFAIPVDVSGKRRTRINSAVCALRAVEWRYQDFVRGQVDNLYTAFVDDLAAQSVVDLYRSGKKIPPRFTVDPEEASAKDEAESALRDRQLTLALLLGVPNPRSIRLQGYIVDCRTFPDAGDDPPPPKLLALKRMAFENRPDLHAKRWDLQRAAADVEAVRAGRLDDVTFLVEPYTYSPMLLDHVGWALGVTVPMPLFNRQQGNLAKAESILRQTRIQLTALERVVDTEVQSAYNEVTDSWGDVVRFNSELNVGDFPSPTPPDGDDSRIEEGLSLLDGRYELLMVPPVNDIGRIPTAVPNLFIVVIVKGVLHFRILNDDGKILVDTDEEQLRTQKNQIDSFKKRYKDLWPPRELTVTEKSQVMDSVARIVGLARRVYLREALEDHDIVKRFVTDQMRRDVGRRRRNLSRASLRHRKSLLRLNTVCGCIVVQPGDPPPPCPPLSQDRSSHRE